jgi:hypothetical protein
MWRWLFLSATVAFLATPAYSANRFYCAVDDANVKLSVDSGFDETVARELNHFRGAMIAKATEVPDGFKRLMFESNQLVHNWSYDGDLRLEVYAQGKEQDASQNFDLVIMASGKNEAAPMPGSYVLTFNSADRPQPLQFKGRLTCSAK